MSIQDLAERTTCGRRAASDKSKTQAWRPDKLHPPAVTRPGERWSLNGFNLSSVIIVRDGPDDRGHNFVDGQHQVRVAEFLTVRDAAGAVQAYNAFNVIVDMFNGDLSPQDFHDRVGELLASYGRAE